MAPAAALPTGESARIIAELGRLGEAPMVEPFQLGRARSAGPEKLLGVERIGEKIARGLRPIFESLSQARSEVSAEPVLIQRWDEWTASLPGFTSLSGYRLRPTGGGAALKGGMVVAVPPGFVTALLELFYGGGSGDAPAATRDFTAGEDLLLGRLLDRLVPMVTGLWAEATPIAATLAERETAPAHCHFLRPDEPVVVQRFRVAPLECIAATIAIVTPLAVLRPLDEQMASRGHDEPVTADSGWRARLATAMGDVPLPVRSVLAQPEITLGQLMALKPGDVIPIQLGTRTPLLVASHAIAEGQIGERDGRAALMIEQFKRK